MELNDSAKLVDLLTRACGDIGAALIMAGKADKVTEWTKPYVDVINAFDAAAISANAEPRP